jgi:hypothetical protein
MQTLTYLSLWSNEIKDEGVRHLAEALQNNTVNHIVYSSISSLWLSFQI